MTYALKLLPILGLSLAACSNSPSGPPSGTTYEPVSNLLTGGADGQTGTADLAGVSIRSNTRSGVINLVLMDGEIDFDTGQITLADGTYKLIDPNGADGAGLLTDGSSTMSTAGPSGFSGDYDFVFTFDQVYTEGSTSYDSSGLAGTVTLVADIPDTGTGSYDGEAIATVITGSSGFDLAEGTSAFVADFGNGTVDVDMDDFTVTDQTSGSAASAPLDRIRITGMTISGNRFADGTLKTTLDNADVNITGNPTTTTAEGTFFGYDDNASAPDEIGVSLYSKGDNGMIIATAIGD